MTLASGLRASTARNIRRKEKNKGHEKAVKILLEVHIYTFTAIIEHW
jgi:hypothetical protein